MKTLFLLSIIFLSACGKDTQHVADETYKKTLTTGVWITGDTQNGFGYKYNDDGTYQFVTVLNGAATIGAKDPNLTWTIDGKSESDVSFRVCPSNTGDLKTDCTWVTENKTLDLTTSPISLAGTNAGLMANYTNLKY